MGLRHVVARTNAERDGLALAAGHVPGASSPRPRSGGCTSSPPGRSERRRTARTRTGRPSRRPVAETASEGQSTPAFGSGAASVAITGAGEASPGHAAADVRRGRADLPAFSPTTIGVSGTPRPHVRTRRCRWGHAQPPHVHGRWTGRQIVSTSRPPTAPACNSSSALAACSSGKVAATGARSRPSACSRSSSASTVTLVDFPLPGEAERRNTSRGLQLDLTSKPCSHRRTFSSMGPIEPDRPTTRAPG